MYWSLGRWRAAPPWGDPSARPGGPLLLAFAPVAVDDDLGRASLDDLAILRGEVIRQFAPRVMSGHRRGPSRMVVRAAADVFSARCLRLPLGVSSTGGGRVG